jgi:enolase
MVNMVSGGAHAAGAVAIQDVLAIPHSSWRVEDAIETAWRVRKGTREVMTELGFPTALIADEGGLAAGFSSSEDAIKAVVEGVSRVGLVSGDDVGLALDVAANEFLGEGDRYQFEGETLSDAQLVAIISRWASTWPISSIEDPLAEDADWTTLAPLLMKTQIVGDDRYATSVDRLATGISRQEANSVLIKPNQAGTLWGALEAIRTGKEAGWGTIVSARSGDTEEQWLVDLAVGSGAGQIKVGSTMRSERTAKWNRMLELSARENLPYAGNEK